MAPGEPKKRRRAVVVLVDGIADVSLPGLGDRTPLQAAHTPYLDAMAACGANGLMDPVEPGLACGSDTAHLSLLGYPPRVYYKGRGAFESMGAGLAMSPGDIAFKCNFATMDESTGIVERRRADRNFEEEGPILCRHLDGLPIPSFPDVSVSVKYATEHRCGVVVRGQGLSNSISGTDPLKDERALCTAEPLDDTLEAKRTAEIVNALSDAFRDALRSHPINEERRRQGKGVANVVLLRGCGIRIEAPPFAERHGFRHAAMVAPTKIIAGLGMSLGFDVLHVPGATGDYRTCLSAKADSIARAVSTPGCTAGSPLVTVPGEEEPQPGKEEGYDFGFLHIKGIDDAGHDKAAALKVRGLEAVDQMIGQLVQRLYEAENSGVYSYCICVTGDHSTPVLYGDHSFEPVPFVVCRLKDLVASLGEDAVRAIPPLKVLFPSPEDMPQDLSFATSEEAGTGLRKGKDKLLFDPVGTFDELAASRGCLGRFFGGEMITIIRKLALSC